MRDWFAFALLTALFWGTAPVLEKFGLGRLQPMAAVAIRSVVVGVASFGVLLGTRQVGALLAADWRAIAAVALAGVLSAFIGQFTYFSALKAGPVSGVVPVAAAYPLTALVLAALFLHEPVSLQRVAGVVCVVVGIYLVR